MTCISKYLDESLTFRPSIIEQWLKMVQGIWMREERPARTARPKTKSADKFTGNLFIRGVHQEQMVPGAMLNVGSSKRAG